MTDNGSDWIKQANETAALSLWHSYCDMKMELENANDRIEHLEAALREIDQTSYNQWALRFTNMSYAMFAQTVRNIARKALEGKDD